MDMVNDLMLSRILLGKLCDGFSQANASKNLTFSIKLKVLFLLEDKDQTPQELISTLCIAKSNLANLLKTLNAEGFVESYKNENNSRNVFYHLLDAGREEIKRYKTELAKEVDCKLKDAIKIEEDIVSLTKNLKSIIEILERN